MATEEDIERVRVRAALRRRLFDVEAEPARVGRFELRERIGEGASGVVYRAHDPTLSRDVALKVLRGRSSTAVRERLEREGRALAKLTHPNVVAVYDVGEHRGEVFLAMELVPGTDLRRWLAAAARADREVLDVIALAGAGLAAAHREGLVHRDFKAENVLVAVGTPGRVLVADFGLAAVADDADGVRVGTPGTMAPEQWERGEVDARADQYALAVVALEALSREVLTAGTEPPSRDALRRALGRVPRGLRPLLARALSPSAADRFATVDAFLVALAAWRARARRLGLAATVAALATLVGALGVHAVIPARSPCAGASQRLAGAWDDAAAARVDAAFRATGLPFAPRSAELVRRSLDAYRDAWTDARTDVCEATHVRHEQSDALLDARMRCLDDARDALAATASVLAHADATSVARATRVVDALPPVAACRALELHEGVAEDPPAPADRRTLARANAALAAGRLDDARGDAERAATGAHALHAPRLEAEARTTLGRAEQERGRYDGAEAALFDAVALATRAGDRPAAARACVALSATLGLGLARYADAVRWAGIAEAELAGVDGAAERGPIEADRQLVLMDTQRAVGRPADASATARTALALARREHAAGSPALATALTRIGFVLGGAEGCALVEEGRAIRERVLGADHPDLGESYDRLASCAQNRGDDARADALYTRALAIRLAALGPDSRDVARSSFNFAWLRLAEDRLDDAASLYTAARRGYAHAGNRHFEAAAIAGLAEVRYRERLYDESLSLLDDADAIYRETLPHESGSVARTQIQRGNVLLATGRPGDARARYEEAARISDVTGETGVATTARLGAGLAAIAERSFDDAVTLLERVASAAPTGDASRADADLAVARFQLARALTGAGRDPERARSLAEEARRALVDQPHPERATALVADIDAFLAAPSLAARRSEPGHAETIGTYRMRW